MSRSGNRTCGLAVGIILTCGLTPAFAQTLIIDNGGAGYTSSGMSTVTGSGYGGSYQQARTANSETAWAKWTPTITVAGRYEVAITWPSGTNRASNSPFTVCYGDGTQSQTFAVNQQINAGIWNVLGTFDFQAGTAGYVRLSNRASPTGKYIAADAVRFTAVPRADLTMAVSPSGGGFTTPAAGNTYPHYVNDVVSITAEPALVGYAFSQWQVSAGSPVANPTSTSTTVTMDVAKTVTAVFVPAQANLTMAVSPAGGGTTSPAEGGPYSFPLNQNVSISATPVAGYCFVQWTVSGGANAANPTSPTTTIRMDLDKTVTANFAPIQLTMAVSPAGAGTTTPPVGGPYPKSLNEVVSISAAPASGYAFNRWQVSAGAEVAEPTSASTTVTMDTAKTVTAVFAVPQLRAFWADAFHEGFKSKAEIDNMVARALTGGYNTIVAEVCAYHDNASSSHGAYWNSSIVPKAPDITTTGLPNGDPLAYLVQTAHANNLEVDCWLVAFRMCTVWPPAGNSYLAAHPEFISVPAASLGLGAAKTGSDYVLDAGSPEGQDYLMSVIRELVTNYAIDGVNWDYIRYTQNDGGYPSSNSYVNSGLKRYWRIQYPGNPSPPVPPATGDTNWDNFRRRTIDEVVRRTRTEAASITANPRQPVRFTCDLVTWGDAPANFSSSSAYGLYSNWELWMRKGYLDGGMPMCYDREYNASQALYYRHWVDACVGWKYSRHMYIGQANYLNTMADSITQLQYALSHNAEGTINYSYASTVDSNMDGVTETDWTWYSYVGTNLFTSPAAVPGMPWRDPGTATEGSVWGKVTKAGAPVDDATVTAGAETARTDANGYYVLTLLPATGSVTLYTVSAAKGSDSGQADLQVVAGGVARQDIAIATVRSITGWRSLRTHAGTTELGITLDPTAGSSGPAPTVEPRQGGIQKLAVTFSGSISLPSAAGVHVTGYTTTSGGIGPAVSYTPTAVSVSGTNTLIITFDPGVLPDGTCYRIEIAPGAIAETITGDADCLVRPLVGDATGSGAINLGDLLLVKANAGHPAVDNPALDIDLNGTIEAADMALIAPLVTSPAAQVLCP